ncbi:MAG: aspartate--tRNA ligase [Candidatus Riflebacteria bacterium]|nr:aspartate--tRNA ligase [Candidatus Riflebacteria bacterium]
MHQYRTHHCGELRGSHVGQTVRVSGWVQHKRDLGGVLFVTLRDNYGLTQVLVPPGSASHQAFEPIRLESVVTVEGVVRHRGEGNVNPKMSTGEIEVEAAQVTLQGPAEVLPFPLHEDGTTPEATRLTFRFLDLRTHKLHENILLRSRVIASIRRRMIAEGFNEFQTPILTSSSPEGARDYLVPSRLYPGKFYALPQAPQQFKQLLMVSGFDRYFQIAPCFRDEDARADRSPGEFYQLDLEMSFVTQDDVFATVERVIHGVFTEFSKAEVSPTPFVRLKFDDAMRRYGSDKPDLRFGLEIEDVSDIFARGEFRAFRGVVEAGGAVRALCVPGAADKSRKFFDDLEAFAKEQGAKGLATLIFPAGADPKGTLAKPLPPAMKDELQAKLQAPAGSALLFIAEPVPVQASVLLGKVRVRLADLLDLRAKNVFKLCWITDFPMYEKDPETGQTIFSHNPFSMPQGGLEALLTQDPLTIKAYQYDLVCNGVELSSGAIRNHRPDIMYKAFAIAGYSQEEVDARFGGMIRAFKFGAPPHGGIAPGIDRIVMLLADERNIREVIAFPMNQNAQDLLMGAPCEVTQKQLDELHLKIVLPEKKA